MLLYKLLLLVVKHTLASSKQEAKIYKQCGKHMEEPHV